MKNMPLFNEPLGSIFDNDPQKVDMQVNNKQIFHISKIPNLVDRLGVDIAILTVPRQHAQEVADFLIKSKIKYIKAKKKTKISIRVPKSFQTNILKSQIKN